MTRHEEKHDEGQRPLWADGDPDPNQPPPEPPPPEDPPGPPSDSEDGSGS